MTVTVTTFEDALPYIRRSIKFKTRHVRYYREDLTQGALLATFARYKTGDVRSLPLLCHNAKQAVIHEKRRMFRQVGTIPDGNRNYIRLCMFEHDLDECHTSDDETDDNYRPVDEVKGHYEPGPDTPEIREADRRMDLQALLLEGFRKLSKSHPHLVSDMKLLMEDIGLGYNHTEMMERHGWKTSYTTTLKRVMREVFGNGEYVKPGTINESQAKRLVALVEKGYSIRAAARTLGVGRQTAAKHIHAAQA